LFIIKLQILAAKKKFKDYDSPVDNKLSISKGILGVPSRIKNSLSTRLLRLVFSIYFIFTLLVTAVQVYVDFDQAEVNTKKDLTGVANSIQEGLSNAVWNLDDDLIEKILNGVLEWKQIVGVTIVNEKGELLSAKGDSNSGEFPLSTITSEVLLTVPRNSDKPQIIGKLTVYSNRQVVFEKIKPGLVVLVINAIIKSIVLWILFLWAFRRYLSVPLQNLANETARINPSDIKTTQINESGHYGDEINVIAIAFNSLLEKLSTTLNDLKDANRSLDNKLTSSASILSTTLDSTADGILVETHREKVLAFNKQFTSICACHNVDTYLDSSIVFNEILSNITNSEQFAEKIARLKHDSEQKLFLRLNFKDGRTVECYEYPQKIENIVTGRVWSFRDITDIVENDRIKNEFISTVNHELRTPLTSIRGSIALLLGGVSGDLSEKARELLTIAHNNCDRLMHIVNDILDAEKILAGKMNVTLENVAISTYVDRAIAENRAYGEKFGINYLLVERDENAVVSVDTRRFLQVMANLLSNAAKFSRKGDNVYVRIFRKNGNVGISVTDYGVGIPAEYRNKVFKKFSQIDASNTRLKSGTGLGLSICQFLVEAMHGDIYFESEPNVVTTFTVVFPEVAQSAGTRQQAG